jgi:hypothetical protein
MNARPLHKIAAAVGDTQKVTLELMRELQHDGLVEPVGNEKFWRLTDIAQREYGEALQYLAEAAA